MIVMFAFSGANAQGTLKISALNIMLSAADSITFEYWITNQTTEPISYMYGQYFTNIRKSSLGGATSGVTLRILASDLPTAFVPRNPTVFWGTGDTAQLRLAANTSPGIGNGLPILPGANLMVCRLSLRLPAGFVFPATNPNWDFWWRTRLYAAPQTKIFYDPGGSSIEYTNVSYIKNIPWPTVPVKLASFTASTFDKRDVRLTWTTAQELNNSGFDIERKTLEGQYSKVGFISGKGTTNSPTTYTFEDKKLNSGKYNYRLKQIDYNGNYEYFELSSSIEIGLPTKYDLSQNYPNPFNPSTKIDYDLPFDSHVSLKIYDMTGREVMSVINNEAQQAGFYTIQLNASNLASGTYFFRLVANDNIFTKRMVLLK